MAETVSTGYVLRNNNDISYIDLSGYTHLVSARVRWRGVTRWWSAYSTYSNYSTASGIVGVFIPNFNYPTVPSGAVFDYCRARVRGRHLTGAARDMQLLVRLAGALENQWDHNALASGVWTAWRETGNITPRPPDHEDNEGNFRTQSGESPVDSPAIEGRTETRYHRLTQNPQVAVGGITTSHSGTLNDGAESSWYNLTGLVAGQNNEVTHGISGSLRADVEIEFTAEPKLPPPALASPAPGERVDDRQPWFEFTLVEDTDNSATAYHARLRVSEYVSMDPLVYEAESESSQAGWEQWDGGAWVAFPSGGVSPGTLVRHQPQSLLPYGTLYWNAASYDDYDYGNDSPSRSVRVGLTVEEVYALTIAAVSWDVFSLRVVETSNGELGEIVFEVANVDGAAYADIDYGDTVIVAFNDAFGNEEEFEGVIREKDPQGEIMRVTAIMGDGIFAERIVKEDYASADIGATIESLVDAYCAPITTTGVETSTGWTAPVPADGLTALKVIEELRRKYGFFYFVDRLWDMQLYLEGDITAADVEIRRGDA